MGLFGSAPPKPTLQEQQQNVRNSANGSLHDTQQRSAVIDAEVIALKKKAVAMRISNPQRARQMLQLAKQKADFNIKSGSMALNTNAVLSSTEMATHAMTQASVMREGANYMTALQATMGDVGDVEETMEDVNEAMEMTNEMVDAVSGPLRMGGEALDEDDMDAELAAMADQEAASVSQANDEQAEREQYELEEQLLNLHVPSSPDIRPRGGGPVPIYNGGGGGTATAVRPASAPIRIPTSTPTQSYTRSMLDGLAD